MAELMNLFYSLDCCLIPATVLTFLANSDHQSSGLARGSLVQRLTKLLLSCNWRANIFFGTRS
jgi:hypothetical protein